MNRITPETKIEFTIKSFLSLIVTILGIFIGFYQLVIVPKMENTEKNIIEKVVEVKEDVDNLNSNLSSVNTTVTVLSTRFSDLNNLNSIPSAGGFGND